MYTTGVNSIARVPSSLFAGWLGTLHGGTGLWLAMVTLIGFRQAKQRCAETSNSFRMQFSSTVFDTQTVLEERATPSPLQNVLMAVGV